MKKMIMVAALMLLSVSAAFAGNSDALKAILKAQSYSEASKLVESSLGQLADNAEKATAYNKVVDLALDAFNGESKKVAAQQGDEAAMYDALATAFTAASECNKGKAKVRQDQCCSSVSASSLSYQCRWLLSGQGQQEGFQFAELLYHK